MGYLSLFSYLIMCVAVCGCTLASPLRAQETEVTSAGPTKADHFMQSYVWYEGERRKTVWMNPNRIAEYPSAATEESPIPRLFPGSSLLSPPELGVRIWRLPEGTDPESVLKYLNTSQGLSARYSPVFHDAPGPASRMRALPGNIIVYLNPEWDEESVNQWISLQGLKIVKKLASDSRGYVFMTAPGLEALDQANAIYESGEVEAAFPDWWQEVATR